MASSGAGPSSTTSPTTPANKPNPLAIHPNRTENRSSSSTSMEMNNLQSHAHSDAPESSREAMAREEQFHTPAQSPTVETSQAAEAAIGKPSDQYTDSAPMPPLKREQTAPAIGPSSDRPTPLSKEAESDKVLLITLLLTNGARHPYKIDEKYLKKRNVSVESDNPINLSIYDLKNLIWREWRDGKLHHIQLCLNRHVNTLSAEWESRPTNPTSIRLIYAGQMPGDSAKLKGMYPHRCITPQRLMQLCRLQILTRPHRPRRTHDCQTTGLY